MVGQSLKGGDVTGIMCFRGRPEILKTDNGSEFAGKVMDRWAYERDIKIDFSRPGKPTDNATVESFNGRLRQKCLKQVDRYRFWLTTLESRKIVESHHRH